MGIKRGNLKLTSGLLLPSFTLNYMLIRVKERGVEYKIIIIIKNKERQKKKENE